MAMAEGEVQQIDGCDEAIWDQLQVGEILDLGVTLSIPDIVRSLGMVGQISALMPLFSSPAGSELEVDRRRGQAVRCGVSTTGWFEHW